MDANTYLGYQALFDHFHEVFGPHITYEDDQWKEVLKAMYLCDDWLSNWIDIGKKSELSPKSNCEYHKQRTEYVHNLLKQYNLGIFSQKATDLGLLYCFYTYPHGIKPQDGSNQKRIGVFSKAQTYLVLATASIWLLDMLFDDVRKLYVNGKSILGTVDQVLDHFDGIEGKNVHEVRTPPDVSHFTENKQIQKLFYEFCILFDLCYIEGYKVLTSETLKIVFDEYRRQIVYFRNEIENYTHSNDSPVLEEYMNTRVLSSGFQWVIVNHMHILGQERSIGDHSRITDFLKSEMTKSSVRFAAEYCCLINDIFSILSDSKHLVANPVIFLGKQEYPDKSKEEQLYAGIDMSINIAQDSFSKLIKLLENMSISSELDKKIYDLYIEVLFFVCYSSTTFHILSPRYNLELCKKYLVKE
ncbi:terpene synthase family protein [Aquimarina gracilis]|uniref:Terpene synthase family protein n=1 Tax=Aquimarina gracilis TaxID=874422 RepID=A0ABU5ZVT6_9FLAO|nr:terpene synthase family protein [Aquimarina gracilis]MEB3346001.1 terpene synthase family protein [Aquimarina gracilis]